MSLSKAFAIAFAVGIRPCTGALTLLFLTLTQGVLWVGILATFAMALGTAIMVSLLACMAIGSRELASRFAGEGSPWGWRLERAAGLTGLLAHPAHGHRVLHRLPAADRAAVSPPRWAHDPLIA